MGLFDSVYVPCPKCAKPVEFQSKAGDPYLNRFTLDDAPLNILLDIMNRPVFCTSCGAWLAVVDPRRPLQPPVRPETSAVKVTAPENPVTHPSGLRWWPDDLAFTINDIEELTA